ncbi:hypothetical protein QJS66_11240 [Kocuria rhizophila]|nr:hypothetical protein QJS66_11240 [Kocuria rhizophila]
MLLDGVAPWPCAPGDAAASSRDRWRAKTLAAAGGGRGRSSACGAAAGPTLAVVERAGGWLQVAPDPRALRSGTSTGSAPSRGAARTSWGRRASWTPWSPAGQNFAGRRLRGGGLPATSTGWATRSRPWTSCELIRAAHEDHPGPDYRVGGPRAADRAGPGRPLRPHRVRRQRDCAAFLAESARRDVLRGFAARLTDEDVWVVGYGRTRLPRRGLPPPTPPPPVWHPARPSGWEPGPWTEDTFMVTVRGRPGSPYA